MERSLKRPADAAFLPSASTSERGSAVDLVSLEDDALARVFRQVGDPKSLARLSLVSRRWRDALATCGAWRMLCPSTHARDTRARHAWHARARTHRARAALWLRAADARPFPY